MLPTCRHHCRRRRRRCRRRRRRRLHYRCCRGYRNHLTMRVFYPFSYALLIPVYLSINIQRNNLYANFYFLYMQHNLCVILKKKKKKTDV